MNKTVLVTGAAGFIGSHIVDLLVSKNFKVIGVDNLKNGRKSNINKSAIFYNMDLNNKNEVKKLLKKHQPEKIIHQASNLVDVWLSIKYPQRAYKDLIMTTNMIEAGYLYGLKQVIFSSSANVYGDQKKLPITERVTLNPASPYGLTKAAIENYLRYFAMRNNIKYTIFRYFNVYGERQNSTSYAAIPTFINKMLQNKTITIRGGSQTRDFIYVKDVARANLLACENDINGTFNLGSGKQIQVNQLVKLISKLTDREPVIERVEKDNSDYDHSMASILKIRKVLGWKPTTTLTEGLKPTIDYYSNAKNQKS